MKDINNITIVGRLVKDAELHKFNEEAGVIQFSIASNTVTKKDGQYADVANFFNCKHFGKNQDKLTSLLVKGKQVVIDGYLSQERWEGQDGKKNSQVIINAETIQLVGGKTEPASGSSFQEDIPYSDGSIDDGSCPF